ncbi:MAG: ATP-binding cassette domain-containing protein [Ancalomicrobiaceae bacterium]|nr:ATP-binding cassette domain-containing protein [Ancalomicrobiaceae bacterium]
MISKSPVIETDSLTKNYGTFCATDHISLTVTAGEIFGLIGPNGAGKSTLIKMLTTLLPPTSGSARVAGFDLIGDAAHVRAHIGYVPQLLSSDGALTAYENLLMSARLYAIPRAIRQVRIAAALKMLDLSDAADKLVQSYSGGMIRRLEIAQSMIHQPAVLFMDEPTVGLDPVARRNVWAHIRDLRDRLGTTILLTTHLMDEAEDLCDRLGVLNAGRLQSVGTPRELEAAVGSDATLDDVFAAITGSELETEGGRRNVQHHRDNQHTPA